MKKTNWFILSFLILITVPTLVWAVYRLFTPGKLEEEVRQENRTLSEIKWSELLSSCQSINNWYNDRAPFRKNLISLYQNVDGQAEKRFEKIVTEPLDKLLYAKKSTKDPAADPVPATLPYVGPAIAEGTESASHSSEEAGRPGSTTDSTEDITVIQPGRNTCEHSYREEVLAPADCTHEGKVRLICEKCGETSEKTVPAVGHQKEKIGSVAADYESWGYTDYRCRLCGRLFREDVSAKKTDESYLSPKTVGEGTILGKYDWLFYTGNNTVSYYKGTNLLNEEEMAPYAEALTKLQSVCDKLGIRLAVMFVPCKEQVYAEYMPDYTVETDYKRTQRLVDYLKAHTATSVLYPLEELKAGDLYHLTYFKYDTHWTDYGAFIGTNSLYQALGIDSVDPMDLNLPGSSYEISDGDLVYIGGLSGRNFASVKVFKPDYWKESEITWEQSSGNDMVYSSESTGPVEHRLVFVGDSLRLYMMPYLSKTFQKTLILHRDYLGGSYKEKIMTCGTLVIEIGERYDYKLLEVVNKLLSIMTEN